MPKAVWFGARRPGVLFSLGIALGSCFCGPDISDRSNKARIVEPVDPFEGGESRRFGAAPRAAPVGLNETPPVSDRLLPG